MTKSRTAMNGEDASDLVAVLVSNSQALLRKASQVKGDIDRLHTKINATHCVIDRLHRKIESTHARVRIFRARDRIRHRK